MSDVSRNRRVAEKGDLIADAATGREIGRVEAVQPPNYPWHGGGMALVGGRWWHPEDYVVVEYLPGGGRT